MNDTEYLQKLVQVARLYYEENMTQQAISKKLGTTRQSISKMLSEARERSIVEIKINDVETNLSKAAQMIKEIFPIQNVTILTMTRWPGRCLRSRQPFILTISAAKGCIKSVFHGAVLSTALSSSAARAASYSGQIFSRWSAPAARLPPIL